MSPEKTFCNETKQPQVKQLCMRLTICQCSHVAFGQNASPEPETCRHHGVTCRATPFLEQRGNTADAQSLEGTRPDIYIWLLLICRVLQHRGQTWKRTRNQTSRGQPSTATSKLSRRWACVWMRMSREPSRTLVDFCVRLQDGASVQFKIKCAYIQSACSSRCLHGTSIQTCL